MLNRNTAPDALMRIKEMGASWNSGSLYGSGESKRFLLVELCDGYLVLCN